MAAKSQLDTAVARSVLLISVQSTALFGSQTKKHLQRHGTGIFAKSIANCTLILIDIEVFGIHRHLRAKDEALVDRDGIGGQHISRVATEAYIPS